MQNKYPDNSYGNTTVYYIRSINGSESITAELWVLCGVCKNGTAGLNCTEPYVCRGQQGGKDKFQAKKSSESSFDAADLVWLRVVFIGENKLVYVFCCF